MNKMCYVGRRECGCIKFVATADPRYRKKIATEVAEAMAAGLSIERMSVEEAMALPKFFGDCDECRRES